MNQFGFKADSIKNSESLAYFNGGAAVAPPATFYLALCTGVPTRAGTFTEVSGVNYARVAIAANSTNWTVVNGKVSNALQINFPTPGGAWTTAYGWALMSASSGGVMWHGGSLAVQPGVGLVLGASNSPHVPAGALVIQP